MKRLYEPAAYAPPDGCFWADTVSEPDWPALEGEARSEVAVIGGGFTGLSAALHLAEAGVEATLLEAETPGFGASGRNGGFCCLGGAKAPGALIARRVGAAGLIEWHATQRAAIDTVAGLLDRLGIAADTHSDGETQIAHSPRAMARLRKEARAIAAAHGVTPVLTEAADLRAADLGGPFHGALTVPLGFALNPRKYHHGLARAASDAGARLCARSPATALTREDDGWRIATPRGTLRASKVLIATNGYSTEDVPDWLRGRTLPVQSSIVVTRPLGEGERAAQGWTSRQMAYDSRTLLHYFRRLPDDRFLFGMRGGLYATPRAEAAIRARIRRDFHAMFPAWKDVEITHDWSGLVCLMANLTPFAGPVPEMPGVYAGLGYHGNGVAMASHTGRMLAALMRGASDPGAPVPAIMRMAPGRFPLGRFRRMLLGPAYVGARLFDS